MRTVDPALLGDSEERGILRGVARDFFATAGADWSRMAKELGMQGLAIPEEYGGAGSTFAELAVVLEEAGRALTAGPLLPTVVLAGSALQLGGDASARARYLPDIAAGTLTATVVFGDVVAVDEPAGWFGDGTADFVLDGAEADLLIVAAGSTLFACAAGAEGLERRSLPVLDPTRPQATVTFRRTPLTPIGPPGGAAGVVSRVLDLGRTALAAEQVGLSAHVLDATVAYVLQRRQFGRPIGSFQAVKHRLADLLVDLEAARSAAGYAVACAVSESDELPVAACAAQVVCSEVARRAAEEYVQLHGGIGFTWEHPAHRYLRRARSSEVLFGTADEHRSRLGALLGI